jgi:hypothetical protein
VTYEWFTLNEIAKLRGLTYDYVKNLASVHQWRRTNTSPKRYHISDVMETLGSAKK